MRRLKLKVAVVVIRSLLNENLCPLGPSVLGVPYCVHFD